MFWVKTLWWCRVDGASGRQVFVQSGGGFNPGWLSLLGAQPIGKANAQVSNFLKLTRTPRSTLESDVLDSRKIEHDR